MNEQNYFLRMELEHHHNPFASRLSNFTEIVVINAGNSEALLLNQIFASICLESQRLNLTFIGIPNGLESHSEFCVLDDLKEFKDSSRDSILFILFKNRSTDFRLVQHQFHLLDGVLAKSKNKLLFITESFINNFSWNKYIEVAEDEYKVLIDGLKAESLEKKDFGLVNHVEGLYAMGLDAYTLSYNNLYGPSLTQTDNTIMRLCDNAKISGVIQFESTDKQFNRSYTYICDLVTTIGRFLSVTQHEGSPLDSTFHISSFTASDFEIKTELSLELQQGYEARYPRIFLSNDHKYSILQRARLNRYSKPLKISLRTSIQRTFYSLLPNAEYDEADEVNINQAYAGKIDILRKLEVDILQEVKRICEKYNIRFFLVGGSLLGAVRHKGFIPWDDDLDIGMLREDFEKFREVVKSELNPKYYYETYLSNDGSHYIFDKIRVNDTIFSTKWSSQFRINNGIFVDILVYDKTSNYELLQRAHITMIRIVKRLINIKWINRPRKSIHYRLTLFLLPLLRVISFSHLHKWYEHVIKLYRRSKHSRYILDSVGMNLVKVGPFPLEWFTDTITTKFEGVEVPISKSYDACLIRWYGENYMTLLSPSRRAGHKIENISIGPFLDFDLHGDKNEEFGE